MNLLLDTHAFVWLIAGSRQLPATAREAIARAAAVDLSAASVWEGEMKRVMGRLDVPPLADAARRIGVAVLPVTAEHATAAAHLPMLRKDPFDRMLVAQAQAEELVLMTKDADIGRYGIPVTW